jgi:hypothetical protein
VEEPKQARRQSHTHVHLTEVNEDRHQREGVHLQVMEVMELKAVVLQQREEGRERECEVS